MVDGAAVSVPAVTLALDWPISAADPNVKGLVEGAVVALAAPPGTPAALESFATGATDPKVKGFGDAAVAVATAVPFVALGSAADPNTKGFVDGAVIAEVFGSLEALSSAVDDVADPNVKGLLEGAVVVAISSEALGTAAEGAAAPNVKGFAAGSVAAVALVVDPTTAFESALDDVEAPNTNGFATDSAVMAAFAPAPAPPPEVLDSAIDGAATPNVKGLVDGVGAVASVVPPARLDSFGTAVPKVNGKLEDSAAGAVAPDTCNAPGLDVLGKPKLPIACDSESVASPSRRFLRLPVPLSPNRSDDPAAVALPKRNDGAGAGATDDSFSNADVVAPKFEGFNGFELAAGDCVVPKVNPPVVALSADSWTLRLEVGWPKVNPLEPVALVGVAVAVDGANLKPELGAGSVVVVVVVVAVGNTNP